MEKREHELFIATKFKEKYNSFPEGELLQSEVGTNPDFILTTDTKTIGIEVAEVFQDSHLDNHSHLKRDESVQDKFENLLLEAIQQHTDKHIALGVTLSSHHTLASNRMKELVKQCRPSCMEFIWNNEVRSHIRLSNHYYDLNHPLPDEVDEIFIMILPENIPSFNDQSQGGTVSNLELKHIEPTLIKHSKAMTKYKPCDEYWFVIREGNYHAGSFQEVIIDTPIHSKFNKVFLLRTKSDEVLELK